MNRTRRLGLLGGLVAVAAAAAPFAALWALHVTSADDPLTVRAVLAIAIAMAVLGMPAMLAAWLLWRAWWRQASGRLSALDGSGWLLAAAAATLPPDRRDWGAAMAAELAQVEGGRARWRFATGCARAAALPPGGSRASVGVAGALAVVAVAAAALATGAVLPAGRVFTLVFVGLVGGLATVAVARWGRAGRAGPGPVIAALALVGVAACVVATIYYLAEYPAYPQTRELGIVLSLSPVTAVVLAVLLAGCLWLGLRPPRWLLADRVGRWFGIVMAIILVAGFLLDSRLVQPGLQPGSQGMMGYLLTSPLLVVLPGSVAAAAVGRSFRSGLWACAWAVVLGAPLLIAAWLAEGPHWDQVGRGLVLDGDGQPGGVGANLGDAVWWLLIFLALWALPLGVLGAAAGSWRARRRRARRHTDPAPTA